MTGPAIGMYISEGGKDDAVVQTLERVGIECLPVRELPSAKAPMHLVDMVVRLREEKRPPHLVCRIRNLQELQDWVSALR